MTMDVGTCVKSGTHDSVRVNDVQRQRCSYSGSRNRRVEPPVPSGHSTRCSDYGDRNAGIPMKLGYCIQQRSNGYDGSQMLA